MTKTFFKPNISNLIFKKFTLNNYIMERSNTFVTSELCEPQSITMINVFDHLFLSIIHLSR